jgi:hypothetical protein
MLLAAWLAAAAGVGRPSIPPLPAQSADALQLDVLASGVQSQAIRLRHRLSSAPAPRATSRNPFEFVHLQPNVVVNDRKPASLPTAASLPPPEPNLILIGLAEDGGTRTAMIESGDDLVMAKEGETIVGRYRVAKVATDAIELVDLITGTTRRLFLKSQASPL